MNVFFFGEGEADGGREIVDLLGGKGANLAEMTKLGIPVPPGFTVSAALCQTYLEKGELPDDVRKDVKAAMERLEKIAERKFGDRHDPLLVSVRSGARASMPGMMDTILNLGLNDNTVQGIAQQAGDQRFAWDSYRRFVHMYGDVVYGVRGEPDPFEHQLELAKQRRGVERDIDLGAEDLQGLVEKYKEIVKQHTGHPFPDDPWDQLWGAIEAVYASWNTKRAVDYRKVNRIPDDWGTAVNVLAMVFGNLGEDSGTGVVFSRDPSTGADEFYGEFLLNAQGEDVVAGIRDPQPIASMAEYFPEAYEALRDTCRKLEEHFKDMQDVEFTIQRGKLYLLQTRTAKRTPAAAVRTAVEMVGEGLIDEAEAVRRVDPSLVSLLLHPTVKPDSDSEVIASGLPASPGAAVGKIVFTADAAVDWAQHDQKVVLVRRETSPDDFHGMVAAEAIVTARGGMTSHAAVVARGMGKCCVAGCSELQIDEGRSVLQANGRTVKEGDYITVDGSNGRVFLGQVPLQEPTLTDHFAQLMVWADQRRRLRVRANADTPEDAKRAREFGAEGIGLCRTEHMFFEGDRISRMREMILAQDTEGRRKALRKLLPMQREDFKGIFRAMNGFPVTIRLLDPPLHEFLPKDPEDIENLADEIGIPVEQIEKKIDSLTESNPMLGHRGCRLGIFYPEITQMQAYAIFEAACEVVDEGIEVIPEIMVPLVGSAREFDLQMSLVQEVAQKVLENRHMEIEYLVGTMIELPRAALTADEIAELAEFFSFGTNDLTQTTLGISRDDAATFLPRYVEEGIYGDDPFQTIDQAGVGKLVAMASQLGRKVKPDLKIGICGEHGGDPRSVYFCHEQELNYVSCSPFRVPVARLAAARAALMTPETQAVGD